MSGEVWEVWSAYHERERLCPEGVRVREIAHVHYACESYAEWLNGTEGCLWQLLPVLGDRDLEGGGGEAEVAHRHLV